MVDNPRWPTSLRYWFFVPKRNEPLPVISSRPTGAITGFRKYPKFYKRLLASARLTPTLISPQNGHLGQLRNRFSTLKRASGGFKRYRERERERERRTTSVRVKTRLEPGCDNSNCCYVEWRRFRNTLEHLERRSRECNLSTPEDRRVALPDKWRSRKRQ